MHINFTEDKVVSMNLFVCVCVCLRSLTHIDGIKGGSPVMKAQGELCLPSPSWRVEAKSDERLADQTVKLHSLATNLQLRSC